MSFIDIRMYLPHEDFLACFSAMQYDEMQAI